MFRKEWGSWHLRHRMMPSSWVRMKYFHAGLAHHIQHLDLSTDAWLIFNFQLHCFVYFHSKNRTSTKHQILITRMSLHSWNVLFEISELSHNLLFHNSVYVLEPVDQFIAKNFQRSFFNPCSEDCLFVCFNCPLWSKLLLV